MHFAAGPWFTVLKVGEWKTLDEITLSDGVRTAPARVELRVAWAGENAVEE